MRITRRIFVTGAAMGGWALLHAADEQPPKDAVRHKTGPAYVEAPDPEVNRWEAVGIASRHEFGACYTRKNHPGEKWAKLSRTDEYADVMVRFDDGPLQVIFGRATSYHPSLLLDGNVVGRFPEQIHRRGDGPSARPDKINRHARASVIESNTERVIIHYRYMPEIPTDVGPRNPPDQTTFVDEYFVFHPDRGGLRAVRPGTPMIEEWRDPARVEVTRFQIEEDGSLGNKQVSAQDRSVMLSLLGFQQDERLEAPPAPASRETAGVPPPILGWSFDEGRGREAKEMVSGAMSHIDGHGAIWRRGVSGHALLFDGYTTKIQLPASRVPKLGNSVTLEAWVALAAYPWNNCAVVQQGDVLDEGDGVALGIGPHGQPLLAARIGSEKWLLEPVDGQARIERFRWMHLAGVIDRDSGQGTLYLDGRVVASRKLPAGDLVAAAAPIEIGHGPPLELAWLVGRCYGKFPFGLDGLIDEVRIHSHPLTVDAVASRVNEPQFADGSRQADLERRILPTGDAGWSGFGARHTRLRFHESADSMFRVSGHPDIVVTFDKLPGRYVFWHGAGYVPMMVNENGHWYSNQFNETWWNGGFEPMADKQVVFGRVDILEQSAARVVIRWRYPLSNFAYRIYAEGWADDSGWGEWCDWYFTIYPDGSCIKRMRSWMSASHGREWHESMVILGPGQHPEQVIETKPALTLATLGGDVRTYDWIDSPPDQVDYSDAAVHVVNLRGEFDPYSICRVDRGNVYQKRSAMPYSVFPAWNHWPVGQMPSCGRYAMYPDRTAHSSLTHLYWANSVNYGEQGAFEEKLLLEGLGRGPVGKIIDVARSYLAPPAAEAVGGGFKVAFDAKTRAYSIVRDSGEVREMSVVLEAAAVRPAVNPVFTVENWGDDQLARLTIDGKPPSRDLDIRQGLVRRANGVNALVIWIGTTCREATTFGISM